MPPRDAVFSARGVAFGAPQFGKRRGASTEVTKKFG